MIYIIGGSPRSGKTILAKKLARNLSVSWVSGDTIEGIPKYYTSAKEYSKKFPKDILRRKTHNSNDLMYTKYADQQIMRAYMVQAESVWSSIELFIDSLIAENIDYVVEGYQIPPAKLAQFQKRHPKKIKSLFLIKEDTNKILSGALAHTNSDDWFKTKTTDPKIYSKIADMLSLYGKQLKKEAVKSKIKVINTDTSFSSQIKNALNYLTQ
jgi:2-phosphoglycerate kinase